MDEFMFINHWKQASYRQATTVKGIGDDGAVLSIPSGQLITSVDSFVDGVHFSLDTMNAFHIGYRSLIASMSDIVVMGAKPIAYLVSIHIPSTWDSADLLEIYDGMNAVAKKYRFDLIGGDTSSADQLIISITCFGVADKESIRYRHDAKVGDLVFVTGTLGDSRAGLEILLEKLATPSTVSSVLIRRHQMPNVHKKFMLACSNIKRMSTNDISDGLANECHEIACASDKTIWIEDKKIPLSSAIRSFRPDQYNDWKLFGGEDFEILGTVSPKEWDDLKQIATATDTVVSHIGYVKEKAEHPVYLQRDNQVQPLNKDGYTHLK